MKRAFHFRLARVLRAREIAERTALATWSAAEHVALDAERRTDELRERADRANRETSGFQRGALTPGRILLADRLVQRLWRVLRRSRAKSRDLRTKAEGLRARWSEHLRDRRALERLHERKRAAHHLELARRDGIELDEWSAQRHGRARA